jgi:predicted phosphoribosyltransferase
MAKIIDDPVFRNRIHVFRDRLHAGELLAKKLEEYKGKKNVYVLAIPAGGVQVAFIISKELKIPLDLAITRKIHIPWNKEAGFGAISWNGIMFINKPLVASLGLKKAEIDRCVAEEMNVIKKRLKIFRGDKPFPTLKDKTIIIVDDGLASGFSMLTTVKALEKLKVKDLVVAVPTAPVSAIELIKSHVNEIVCLNIRSGPFFAVADAYTEWYDLTDEDVISVLKIIGYYDSA